MSGASDKISNTDLELTVGETTLPTEATPVIKVFAASDRVRSNNEHLVLAPYLSKYIMSGEMQCDVVYKNIHYSLPVVVVVVVAAVVANYRGKPTLATRQKLAESNQIGMGWDIYCSQ